VFIFRLSILGLWRGRGLWGIGVAFESNHVGVMDEAVDHGCSYYVVTEHLSPSAERFIRGDDQAGPFVPERDQLEEQVTLREITGVIAGASGGSGDRKAGRRSRTRSLNTVIPRVEPTRSAITDARHRRHAGELSANRVVERIHC